MSESEAIPTEPPILDLAMRLRNDCWDNQLLFFLIYTLVDQLL